MRNKQERWELTRKTEWSETVKCPYYLKFIGIILFIPVVTDILKQLSVIIKLEMENGLIFTHDLN